MIVYDIVKNLNLNICRLTMQFSHFAYQNSMYQYIIKNKVSHPTNQSETKDRKKMVNDGQNGK